MALVTKDGQNVNIADSELSVWLDAGYKDLSPIKENKPVDAIKPPVSAPAPEAPKKKASSGNKCRS